MATFVVAHGAWSAGFVWKKMHPLLAAKGHRLFSPTYTGLGERVHLAHPGIDLKLHIMDIANVLFHEDLHDVYLIHGADANRSTRRRAGVAIRYMPATSVFDRSIQREQSQAGVAFDLGRRPIWLMRGADRAGNDFDTGKGEAYRLVPRASDDA